MIENTNTYKERMEHLEMTLSTLSGIHEYDFLREYISLFKISKKEYFDIEIRALKKLIHTNQRYIRLQKKSFVDIPFDDIKRRAHTQSLISKKSQEQRVLSMVYAIYCGRKFNEVERKSKEKFNFKLADEIVTVYNLKRFNRIQEFLKLKGDF